MPTEAYHIKATPKVLERVYYAIDRCKEAPELSALSINEEIRDKYGAPLSAAHWKTLNQARRDNALDRVTTKAFDFSKHGRKARTGKRRADSANDDDDAKAVYPDSRRHTRYIIAVYFNGRIEYQRVRTKKGAERAVRRLVRKGIPIADVAVYRVEAVNLKLTL